jgi:hypothetical protein
MNEITERDTEHMGAFPEDKKRLILQAIMTRLPVMEMNYEGANDYPKTIKQLRDNGMQLIDIQRQETAFSLVWYKETKSWFGRVKSRVAAMLYWELREHESAMITLKYWNL